MINIRKVTPEWIDTKIEFVNVVVVVVLQQRHCVAISNFLDCKQYILRKRRKFTQIKIKFQQTLFKIKAIGNRFMYKSHILDAFKTGKCLKTVTLILGTNKICRFLFSSYI